MTLENHLLVERTKALYGYMNTLLIGSFSIAALTVSVLWFAVNQRHLLIWFAVLSILLLLRTFSVQKYRRTAITGKNAKQWMDKVVFWSFLSGVAWGLLMLLFARHEQIIYIVFMVGVYCGFVSSSVSSMAIYFPAYLAFAVPASLLFLVKCISLGVSGHGAIFYLTSVVIMVFLAVMTSFARNTQMAFDRTTRLTFENNLLMSEVLEQKETAESAVLAKNQFLAAASHDLRQPLHALGLFVSALRDMRLDDEADEIASKIEQSTFSLNGLLNGLLDISKLDASAVEFRPQHVPLKPLLETIYAEYKTTAEDQSSELILDVSDDIYVITDELLLQRVVRNLVDNAVKFTNNGIIRVVAILDRSEEPNMVELIIADTGLGVPEEEQTNIFSEFTQLHNPERDRQRGLGLGLAIVQRLCSLMNLPLDMDSNFGVGTAFTLLLPVGNVRLSKDSIEYDITQEMSEMTIEGNLSSLKGKIVLVIDDEVDILKAMQRLLKQWQVNVVSAIDPMQAIELLNQKNLVPELIIADFRLRNNLSGIDAISQVRDEFNVDISAILVTGDTSPDRLKLAQSAGLPVLHKPVAPMILNETMSEALSKI